MSTDKTYDYSNTEAAKKTYRTIVRSTFSEDLNSLRGIPGCSTVITLVTLECSIAIFNNYNKLYKLILIELYYLSSHMLLEKLCYLIGTFVVDEFD